jgi:hypothetical protein
MDSTRLRLRIKVAGRNVSVDIATKSLREAIATITETSADECVAIVQGRLVPLHKGFDGLAEPRCWVPRQGLGWSVMNGHTTDGRCTSDSCRLAAAHKSAAMGQNLPRARATKARASPFPFLAKLM